MNDKSEIIYGVGLVLVAVSSGRILVLKELEDKPAFKKTAGEKTVPLETIKPGEIFEDALKRLRKEEIGTEFNFIFPPIRFGGEIQIPGIKNVFALPCLGFCDDEFEANPTDTDIAFEGWMSPEELLKKNPLRNLVPPIISALEKEPVYLKFLSENT